jgi:hypothetical protein
MRKFGNVQAACDELFSHLETPAEKSACEDHRVGELPDGAWHRNARTFRHMPGAGDNGGGGNARGHDTTTSAFHKFYLPSNAFDCAKRFIQNRCMPHIPTQEERTRYIDEKCHHLNIDRMFEYSPEQGLRYRGPIYKLDLQWATWDHLRLARPPWSIAPGEIPESIWRDLDAADREFLDILGDAELPPLARSSGGASVDEKGNVPTELGFPGDIDDTRNSMVNIMSRWNEPILLRTKRLRNCLEQLFEESVLSVAEKLPQQFVGHARVRNTDIPLYRYTAIPLYRYTDIPLYRYTAIPLNRYTAIPLYRYTAIPLYRCTAIPLYRCTAISS